jgi:hypothetical protein
VPAANQRIKLPPFEKAKHAGNEYLIACVYAFRNQSDEAFEWLDRAYGLRDSGLIETKVDPLLKNLHADPRFAASLKEAQPAELKFRLDPVLSRRVIIALVLTSKLRSNGADTATVL